jgi:hypothetical protein
MFVAGRDSVAVRATRYRLKGPGIKKRWVMAFLNLADQLRGSPSLL